MHVVSLNMFRPFSSTKEKQMSEDLTQQLLESIAQLQQRLSNLEQVKSVKKSVIRHGHPGKAYAGLSGHYFELPYYNDCETYAVAKEQLDLCLTNPEFVTALQKINLGRAILQHYHTTGNMIFWAPNQESLMFGPARSGVNKLPPAQLFQVPVNKLTQLGAHDGDKVGRNQVELIVQLDAFLDAEQQVKTLNKLNAKLEKMKETANTPTQKKQS